MAIMRIITLLQESSAPHKLYLKLSAYTTKLIDEILNIDTVSLPAKAISRDMRVDDSVIYEGISYLQLWRYINSLKLSSDDVVFDIGCGMGRVLCLFARRPVKKCVGIEVSKELAEIAKQNAMRLRGCKAPIDIVVGDAAEADYSDGTIYCLFNPFGAETLEAVLERIYSSVQRLPRRIWIAYFTPIHDDVLESCDWLRCYKRKNSALRKGGGRASFWTNANLNI